MRFIILLFSIILVVSFLPLVSAQEVLCYDADSCGNDALCSNNLKVCCDNTLNGWCRSSPIPIPYEPINNCLKVASATNTIQNTITAGSTSLGFRYSRPGYSPVIRTTTIYNYDSPMAIAIKIQDMTEGTGYPIIVEVSPFADPEPRIHYYERNAGQGGSLIIEISSSAEGNGQVFSGPYTIQFSGGQPGQLCCSVASDCESIANEGVAVCEGDVVTTRTRACDNEECKINTATTDCTLTDQVCVQPSSGNAYCDNPPTTPCGDTEPSGSVVKGATSYSGSYTPTSWTYQTGSVTQGSDADACKWTCPAGNYYRSGNTCLLDNTAPSVGTPHAYTTQGAGVYSGSYIKPVPTDGYVWFRASIYDGGSGLDVTSTWDSTCEVSWNGGSTWNVARYSDSGWCYERYISTSNTNVRFRVRDNVNNLGTSTSTQYYYDGTAPSVSATGNSNSWFNYQRSATISASDGASGLAQIRYSWGSRPGGFGSCTSGGSTISSGQSTSAPSGGTTLYLCARDNLGNVAEWNGNYRWDNTAPTCGSWSPSTSPWKASGSQSFTLSGSTDSGGSGISVAGGGCTTGSSHGNTCNVQISDNAGNTRTCTSPSNRVDSQAPGLPSISTTTSWTNAGSVPVTISHGSDPNPSSGIARSEYRLTGATSSGWTTYGGQFSISNAGQTTIEARTVDNVGRISGIRSVTVRIDRTNPSVSASNSGLPPQGPSQIVATVSASDSGGSGLAQVRYSFGSNAMNGACTSGGSTTSNGANLNVPEGQTTLYLCARDGTGNTATWSGAYEWYSVCQGSIVPASGLTSGSGTYQTGVNPVSWTYVDSGVPSTCQWTCDDTYVRSSTSDPNVRDGNTCIPRSTISNIDGPANLYIPHRQNTVSGQYIASYSYNTDVPIDYRLASQRRDPTTDLLQSIIVHGAEVRSSQDALYSPEVSITRTLTFTGIPTTYLVRAQYKYSDEAQWPNDDMGVNVSCDGSLVWNPDLEMCTECVYQDEATTPCCTPDGYFRNSDYVCNEEPFFCTGVGSPNTCSVDTPTTYCPGNDFTCSGSEVNITTPVPAGQVCAGDAYENVSTVYYANTTSPYCANNEWVEDLFYSCDGANNIDYDDNYYNLTTVCGIDEFCLQSQAQCVYRCGINPEDDCNYVFNANSTNDMGLYTSSEYNGPADEDWCVAKVPHLFDFGGEIKSNACCPVYQFNTSSNYMTSPDNVEIFG